MMDQNKAILKVAFFTAAVLLLAFFRVSAAQIDAGEFDLDFDIPAKVQSEPETLYERTGDPRLRDVPQDHWAYRAVKYLTERGLLRGYGDGRFHGDEPVTRYELSLIIARLVESYDQYQKTGYYRAPAAPGYQPYIPPVIPESADLPPMDRVAPPAPAPQPPPAAPIIRKIEGAEGAEPEEAGAGKEKDAGEKETASSLGGRTITGNELDRQKAWASRFEPGEIDMPPKSGLPSPGELVPRRRAGSIYQPAQPQSLVVPVEEEEKAEEVKEKPAEEEKKSEEKEEKKEAEKEKEDTKKKEKKKEVKPPDEFSKLGKKVELTEKDVEILEALIDWVQKDVIKKEVDKAILDVERIAKRNERDIEKLEEENQRVKLTGSGEAKYERTMSEKPGDEASGDPSKSFSLNLYSKPRKFDDMTLRTRLDDNYDDGELQIKYQDFTTDRENPRNFKLRSFYGGEVSFGASFLTTMGRDMDGFYTELKLNDYSIKGAIGRYVSDNKFDKHGVEWHRYRDNYIYATSLQFSLFGEPKSWAYVSRIQTTTKSRADNPGRWFDTWGYRDVFVIEPDEKNSVNSIFIRYPMPIKGMFITTEYAHSTYYREGFKLAFPGYEDSWSDYDFSLANASKGWIPIPEQNDQDDGFFIFLDYNKGPLNIFPIGYANLGHTFVSKFLGLPGFDTDDMGLDMLPINLQSIEAWVIRGDYEKLEDKYKWEFLAVKLNETKPMFLDTSAMGGSDMIDIIPFNLIARLNNRSLNNVIEAEVVNNKLSYYLSDNISLSGNFMNIKARLPETCLDGDYVYTYDDLGNVIDFSIGNGVRDCDNETNDIAVALDFVQKSQEWNLFWRTSKKAEFSLNYKIDNNAIKINTSEEGLNQTINGILEDQSTGKSQTMKYNLKYRLTDVSRVEMWYQHEFNRADMPADYDFFEDNAGEKKYGLKLNMSF